MAAACDTPDVNIGGLVAAFAGPHLFIIAKDAFAPIPLAGAYAAIGQVTVVGLAGQLFVRMPEVVATPRQAFHNRIAALSVLRQGRVRRTMGLGVVSIGMMVFSRCQPRSL
ncbi:hypothetical protein [Sulfitobacter guttiformis]|uniref:hypothetical protein n=1 Tax=Sulfitobacter guttiformis TaxID=74349 RepID=UPI0006874E32|nr:hypothetical protein [Sulfitobacter guttiformis]KIN71328.1 Transporter, major facilitator family [Sulfitobacter guttiformis KCTC 32187]